MAVSPFAQFHTKQPWETSYYAGGGGSSPKDEATPAGSITPKVTEFTPAYGGKPAVPDPTAVLGNVLGANMGLMPDIKGLGKKTSNYFWNQTTGRVPGYSDMAAQSAQNIGSLLRGEIPEDVLYNLGQGAAERGITRGGGFSNADYLRSLGLTSLGLMSEGEKGLTGALQRAESVPLFDISKYMLNPQDVFNAEFQANVIGAAPNPAEAAAAARDAVSGGGAGRGTPGFMTGMPALGGIKTDASGVPNAFNNWAGQWAPTGDVGTSGYGPPSFAYDRFATGANYGPAGEDLSFEGGLPAGYADPFADLGGDFYDYTPGGGGDYYA